MKIYKEGDRGQALCETCAGLVSSTYQVCDIPINNQQTMVRGVLAVVCDQCHDVCAIPQQSLARVQVAVNESKIRSSIESRVPIQIEDIFNMACQKLQAGTDFRSTLIRYYAKKMAVESFSEKYFTSLLNNPVVSGKATKRISVKGYQVKLHFESIVSNGKLHSHTDVVKAIALQIKLDILDESNQNVMDELLGYASVA